jgi:hypothetical protein
MDRILLFVAIVFLYSSPSLAANEDRAPQRFQYTLVNYHVNGLDGAKPTAWVGKFEQLTNENATIEERSVNDWLDRRDITPETGIGVGVAPGFDTHGVFRTGSNQDKPTYMVLGFISDEFAMDQAGSPHSRDNSGLSYGFGVNNASFNFEYMMSVDQENYNVSAIGLSLISEF